MIRNYFKPFFRNLRKHRTISLINLIGLSTGIAAALLMVLYVNYELTYDNHFDNSDRLIRITQTHLEESDRSTAGIQFPAAPLIKQDYPEVAEIARIHPLLPRVGSYKEKVFMESGFYLADPSFFTVFGIKALQGSLESALSGPTDMVINESTAIKYFGDNWKSDGVVGNTIKVNNTVDYQIVAVVPNLPPNSHFDFDILLPFGKVYGGFITNNWNFSRFYTYALVNEESDVSSLRRNLIGFADQYFPEEKKSQFELDAQLVKSIHLNSNLSGELGANNTNRQVYLFGAIGLLIVAIAGINFTNLMTAMASRRHKEIGVKKVLGAKRAGLIKYYLIETILLTFLAAVLAIGMVDLSINAFNELAGIGLELHTLWQLTWVMTMLGSVLIIGILSGLYPAFYLTSLKPVIALGSGSGRVSSSSGLSRILVTLQFIITTCLIIAVITIFQQLNFLREKDMGFNKEAVAILRSHPKLNANYEVFRNELVKHSAIENVGFTYGNLLGGGSFSVKTLLDQNGGNEATTVPLLYADYDLPGTMGMQMKEGRWFSKDFATDSTQAFVINETAAKAFGWNENALNKELQYFGGGTTSIEKKGRVIGVVKDFFHESLHEELEPLIITLSHTYVPTFPNCYIPIKVKGDDLKIAMEQIEKAWDAQSTGAPLEVSFLDDKLDVIYEQDQKLGDIINSSAFLALLIASIGVFGLASFTVHLRVKEIGIRKVLGAKMSTILIMMINGFLKPVLIAFLIAIPISIYMMNGWLENFAYKAGISFEVFILTALISSFIAVAAVFGQSLRAARTNPVNVLRND